MAQLYIPDKRFFGIDLTSEFVVFFGVKNSVKSNHYFTIKKVKLMINTQSPDVLLGRHAIIDLSGCNPQTMRSHSLIRDILYQAAQVAKLTVVGCMDHRFEPFGYSAVLILEESHLSIHTWPEHNYASVDLYSCNLDTDMRAIKDYLAEQLQASDTAFTILDRGYTEIKPKTPVPVVSAIATPFAS